MIDYKPSLASYARVSYFRELHGDIAGAVEAMRLAAAATPVPGQDRSYVQSLLGDLEFQRGRLGAAATQYQVGPRRRPRVRAGGRRPRRRGGGSGRGDRGYRSPRGRAEPAPGKPGST